MVCLRPIWKWHRVSSKRCQATVVKGNKKLACLFNDREGMGPSRFALDHTARLHICSGACPPSRPRPQTQSSSSLPSTRYGCISVPGTLCAGARPCACWASRVQRGSKLLAQGSELRSRECYFARGGCTGKSNWSPLRVGIAMLRAELLMLQLLGHGAAAHVCAPLWKIIQCSENPWLLWMGLHKQESSMHSKKRVREEQQWAWPQQEVEARWLAVIRSWGSSVVHKHLCLDMLSSRCTWS